MARGSSRGPGSSTRRPASRRPAARARSARQNALGRAATTTAAGWRERINGARTNRRTVRRVSFGVVIVFLVVLVAPTLRAYLQQQSDIDALRAKVSSQQLSVEELKEEQARWADPAYVEQQARTRLKFVKVGEKSYTVLDPEQKDVTGTLAHGGDAAEPWYDTIWSSMEAADVPTNQRR